MWKRKIGLYEISVVLFFIIVPIIGTTIETISSMQEANISQTLLKWFVFSGVGLRLFSAGLNQAISPSFTAKEIFNITDEKSFVVVREHGIGNICIGTVGILSLFVVELVLASAITGVLFFGIAGFMHLFRKRDSKSENFAMVSDFFIFAALLTLGIIRFL